ncbi:hypothetical protein N341_11995, partial [Tyto alba]
GLPGNQTSPHRHSALLAQVKRAEQLRATSMRAPKGLRN